MGFEAPTFNQGDILTRLRARLSVLDDRPSLQTVKIVQPIFPSPNASSCLSQETPWSKDIFRSRRTSSIGTAIRWHENGQVPLWLSRYSRRPRWGKKPKVASSIRARPRERGLSSGLRPCHPCAQLSVRRHSTEHEAVEEEHLSKL